MGSKPARVWVDLPPDVERGVKAACRSLHMTQNQVIQQAVREFLEHRGLLPRPEPAPLPDQRATRGLAEMVLVREGA